MSAIPKFECAPSLNKERERNRALEAAATAHAVLAKSYLSPLVAMINSHDEDIRRQAVCGISNLVGDAHRAPVAALRNTQGHSLLCDLLEFTRPPFSLVQRKDAINGLSNLLRNKAVHDEVLREHLLSDFLRLSRSSIQQSALVGRSKTGFKPKVASSAQRANRNKHDSENSQPQQSANRVARLTWDIPTMRQIVFCLTSLCANESLAPQLLSHSYVPEIVRLAFAMQIDDVTVRRNAVYAVTALSFNLKAREEIKRHGGLGLAAELLQERALLDLRWQGSMLASNLCAHPANKRDVVHSPLLPQMLQLVLPPPSTGEAEQISLALALLATDPKVMPSLCTPMVVRSLLCLATSGSTISKQHALWTISNLATLRPTEPSLLRDDLLETLIICCSDRGAPSKSARRDALRALSWMSGHFEVGPSTRRRSGVGTGELLEVVAQCSLASDAELQDLALLILCRWSEVIPYHAELVLGGALKPLVISLQYPSPLAHFYGARAIACLSIHRQFRKSLIEEQVIGAPLFALMRSRWPRVRRSACRIACNLSREASGALELMRSGGMSVGMSIARAQSSKSDPLSMAYAEKAVANMYQAWQLEEQTSEQEKESIRQLQVDACGEDEERLAQLNVQGSAGQTQSVRQRVAFPQHVLMAAIFSSWRYVCAAEQQSLKSKQRHKAAGRIQHGIRKKTSDRDRKEKIEKEYQAASSIQSNQRRKKAVQMRQESTAAAKAIQSRVRGHATRSKLRETKQQEVDAVFQKMEISLNQALIRLSDVQQEKRMRLVDVFQKMDLNGDGMISMKEFRKHLISMNLRVGDEELKQFFGALDPSGCGVLNYNDFKESFTALEKQAQDHKKEENLAKKRALETSSQIEEASRSLAEKAKEMFGAAHVADAFDNNKSGSIDRHEFETAAKALGFAASDATVLFDKMDVDSSDTLEYDELDRLYRTEASTLEPPPE